MMDGQELWSDGEGRRDMIIFIWVHTYIETDMSVISTLNDEYWKVPSFTVTGASVIYSYRSGTESNFITTTILKKLAQYAKC